MFHLPWSLLMTNWWEIPNQILPSTGDYFNQTWRITWLLSSLAAITSASVPRVVIAGYACNTPSFNLFDHIVHGSDWKLIIEDPQQLQYEPRSQHITSWGQGRWGIVNLQKDTSAHAITTPYPPWIQSAGKLAPKAVTNCPPPIETTYLRKRNTSTSKR
jgi:hypothetical protein